MVYNRWMAKRQASMSEQIRDAVDANEMSRYRICKLTGISESNMSHFMSGGWLGQENINVLAKVLGMNITTGKPRKGR